jgi:hypothetical protein
VEIALINPDAMEGNSPVDHNKGAKGRNSHKEEDHNEDPHKEDRNKDLCKEGPHKEIILPEAEVLLVSNHLVDPDPNKGLDHRNKIPETKTTYSSAPMAL